MVAFLQPFLLGRDPSYPGLLQSMDRNLTLPTVVNCQVTVMLMVLGSSPSLIQDLKRRIDGTLSLERGNHPTMTQPAN